MTYSELRRSIEVWCSNTDPEFLSEIDRIIRQTENRIGMMLELPNYQKSAEVTFGATMNSYVTPSDFISVDAIFLPGYGILEQKDQSFIQEAYPDATSTGRPRYFAMKDDKTLLLGPTPDVDYPGVLTYFAKWLSIVDLGKSPDTKDTPTFISDKFEAGLLHGCLYYSALFMKDPETAASEKQEMMDSLGLLSKFGRGKAKKQEAEESNSAVSDDI